jgi:D-3-phosphoglycerate dehydrogenase
MTPRVFVSDKLSETAVQIFRGRGIHVDYEPDLGRDKDALLAAIPPYDGLAIRSVTKVSATQIAAAQNLKVIGRAGIGVDNVDLPAATSRGIVVMNTLYGNAVTTAEHALSLMMALARQSPEANASTHAGRSRPWRRSAARGSAFDSRKILTRAWTASTRRPAARPLPADQPAPPAKGSLGRRHTGRLGTCAS